MDDLWAARGWAPAAHGWATAARGALGEKVWVHDGGGCDGVIGVGVDMVEIDRIGEMARRHPESFARKVLGPNEASEHPDAPEAAALFAAKEAVAKALGTGFDSRVRWKDIRVRSGPSGRPCIELSGGAAAIAGELGVSEVLISVAHCRSHAIAFAVAVGPGGERREARDGSGDAGDRSESD